MSGISVNQFLGLPPENQARLWDEQYQMDIDDFEEKRMSDLTPRYLLDKNVIGTRSQESEQISCWGPC